MKKIFICILLIFLSIFLNGCKNKINCSMYISSIGFEIEENQMKITFLSHPVADLSRSQGENGEQDTFCVKTTQISHAFNEAKKSMLSPIVFKHIKTMVFSEEFLNSKYLKMYFDFIKKERTLSFNFYVLATNDKIEDIFGFQNPFPISYQYSILSSPELVNYHNSGTEKLHFLDFANNYYNGNRYIHIPYIKMDKAWSDKKTITINGFVSLTDSTNYYSLEAFPIIPFMYNHDYSVFQYNNVVYVILNYKINYLVKKNIYTIHISFDLDKYGANQKQDLKEILTTLFQAYFDNCIQKEGSIYLIDFYNYQNKKYLNPLQYNVDFTI